MGADRHAITVGPAEADVVGRDGGAIQIAIDALALRGGGTVRVLPGEYVLDDSIRLRPNIALVGDRDRTVVRRGPLVWSRLKVDADASQTEITPEDAAAFRPGMGVCIRDDGQGWAFDRSPYIVTRIERGVLHLNDHLSEERYAADGGIVVNYFPLILAERADNVVIDGFTADSRIEDGGLFGAGLRSAVVRLWRCKTAVVRNVIAKNGHGDGICFSDSSVDATIEDCEAFGNTWYGMHPGSHSARCTVRRCRIHDNGSDGLYICWGIHHSRFEDNEIYRNGWRQVRSGISIGHKDTDNLIARNRIYENWRHGICFRHKTEANGAHRNVIRGNAIENNGTPWRKVPADMKKLLSRRELIACGIRASGITRDLTFEKNVVRETRRGAARTQRHGFFFDRGVSGVLMSGNTVSGHPSAAVVDRTGDAVVRAKKKRRPAKRRA